MIILVDQDGPLANFELHHLTMWRRRYPTRRFVQFEDRRNRYVADDYPPELRFAVKDIYREEGFYRTIPPVPGGRDALEAMRLKGHQVFLCTSPLVGSPFCIPEKLAWIEEHVGREWLQQTIIVTDKTVVHGDVLIDDARHNGVRTPSWEHVVFDYPFNRGPDFATSRRINADWSNWEDVLDGVAALRV